MIGNFTEVKPLCYWVQHILPLVYDDSLSYMELLARVTKRLNELIENNNKLPDYIMELIKEYISSGEIEKVLAEVLANYMLNVKFPPAGLTPATGDGSADDTEAIQGCIDYAFNNGGMSVYFPSGSYLTQPLTLRNKATLFGQDRYTTRLVMKGGATTAMFTGDVDELTLSGLGFDGNMDIQVNNVNLFEISVNSAIISNCLLTDGYDLLNITVNNDLQLSNLLFRHAVENALVLNGAGIVQGENLIFKSVSTLVGKNFVVMGVSKSILEQVKCYGASPNGVLITGDNNVVKMWNEQSLTPYVDNGTNNSITVYTQSEVEKLTGSKTAIIGGNVTETITGNKGVSAHDITETATRTRTENTTGNRNETTGGNVTEIITGDREVSSQNYNETVRGNKTATANKSTENVTTEKDLNANVSRETLATKTVSVSGVNTENSGSKNETITGDKTVKAANSTETIDGDKTVNAGDISNTAANITNHATQDLTEQVDGVRTLTVTGANNETTGARTETVNGNKTEHITGISNEAVDENKTTTVKGTDSIIADEIKLIPSNPLFYGTPQTFNEYYDYVPFNSIAGEMYKVLVGKSTSIDVANIEKMGCVGDGLTDNAEKLQGIINSNVGKIIFIPKGTFLIGNTITLPSGTVIMGSGFNSVIKANNNNFDMFKTENFDNLTNTDTHDSAVGNWMLYNFMIDGNYYSDPENNTLSGRTAGRGLCIYGNNYYLINMIISNNPDTGLWLENNTYDNPAFNILRAGEWTIDRCVIKFNGQHGLYAKSVFDFHLTNSTIASNSRKQHNTYDNLRIDGGNLKCTNCHFYTNYGTIKPKYSVNIMANAGSCTFSNCHIEGAMTPLYIGAEHQIIDACTIYASFGEYDCILAAGHNIITNCRFLYQVGDTSLEKPQWKSAIAFANNPRNCYIFAYCVDTPFIDDMTNCGYLNVFHIYGYNNTNIMDNKACVIDVSKADYIIYGDFGEQSEYKETSSVNNYTSIGAPDALQYDYFAGINGNVTFNNNFCTITGYTSGTLTIGEWATGRLKILINKSASTIPYNTDGITIDGGTSGNILPNSLLILISNTQNNYTSINLAA